MLLSLLAYTIPASAVVVLLTMGYQRWHDHPFGGEFILSAMSAISGLIAGAGVLLLRARWRREERARTVVLVFGALALSALGAGPLTVLLIAGVLGWFWTAR